MEKLDLPKMSTIKPPKPKKSPESNEELPNILDRCFDADYPSQKYVSDITYIWAENRWCYLCVIMDLFARKIIAYKISNKIDGELVRDTIRLAYLKRGCPSNVIFHMDRGSQYTAFDTRKLFDEYNWIESFSKKGCPYGNSVAEAFFKYLKCDEVYRRHYITKEQMENSIFRIYQRSSQHTQKTFCHGYLSPNKKETLYWQKLNSSENKVSHPKKQTAVGGAPNSSLHYQTSIN